MYVKRNFNLDEIADRNDILSVISYLLSQATSDRTVEMFLLRTFEKIAQYEEYKIKG